MLDENVQYTVKVAGVEEAKARFRELDATIKKITFHQNGMVTASGRATSALNNQAGATGRVATATDRASRAHGNYFAHIARTTIQSALINKLFLEFVDVSGQAIKQVDLMNNFPATMASLGQSTDKASESMQALRDYVGQVGGNLGTATSMVTRFTGVTKDVKAATAIFVGLNNALIAGDTSLEEQRLAAIQFSQALERGIPDAREWRSLTQTMSVQLGIVAKEMGYINANALGEALTTGKESMAAFATELTKVSTGTGEVARQAEVRMNGMQFAFNKMKNALIQGVSAIVDTFGRSNIVSFFTYLTQVIQVLAQSIVNLVKLFITLINVIRGLFGKAPVGLKKDVEGVADGLSAGAGAADDMGDNLKDANKSAKALNKSLAGFDKMNVLADKETGGGKKDKATGGAGFDAGQLGDLGDAFGDMSSELQKASIWAKILAGILGGLVSLKFAKMLAPLISGLGVAIKKAGTLAAALGRGLLGKGSGGSGVYGDAAAKGTKIGLAIRTAIIAAFVGFGKALSVVIIGPLSVIGATVAGIFTAATLPLWATVAIGAAVVAAIVALIWLIWKNWETIWTLVKDLAAAVWHGLQDGWESLWGGIKNIANSFWNWLVDKWNKPYDIFDGPVKFLLQTIRGVFIVIVAIVAIALETMFKLWVGAWKLIFALLFTVAKWIYDNVIVPVAGFFKGLWDGLISGVTAAWNWIFEKVLRPIGTWINTNVVQPVIGFFRGLWDTVTGFVSGFFNRVREIMGPLGNWIKTNVIDRISSFFSSLWNGIKSGLSSMMDGLRGIFSGVGNIFKTPLNGIIDLINKAIRGINKLKVPDWVLGMGGKTPGLPEIPRLARGGIVERATLAMIGESGKEAVVPLENNTDWIDKLAAKINTATKGDGKPVQLVVQIGEERIATRIIDLINDKTQMSGRNQIRV